MEDFRRDVCIDAALLLGTGIINSSKLTTANIHTENIFDMAKLTELMDGENARGAIGCYLSIVERIIQSTVVAQPGRSGKVGATQKIVSWANDLDGCISDVMDAVLAECGEKDKDEIGIDELNNAFLDEIDEFGCLGLDTEFIICPRSAW